jgi:hypothetical protein
MTQKRASARSPRTRKKSARKGRSTKKKIGGKAGGKIGRIKGLLENGGLLLSYSPWLAWKQLCLSIV